MNFSRFTYDPLGRRITKHYKENPVILGLDPGIQLDSRLRGNDVVEYHHRYLYAGDNIVAIYDADTDQLIATGIRTSIAMLGMIR